MSEPAKIEDRVTKLETEMAEVRYLAVKADQEASGNTATLRGQVGLLNTLRETQVEHGQLLASHSQILADHSKTLASHGKRLDRLEHKVDDGFAEMRRGFAVLGEGQTQITDLLKARDRPEET